MTTLVTGATGLVGFNVVQSLLRRGRKVRVLARSPEKARKLLPQAVEVVAGDVTDAASVSAAIAGCRVVYHAAGLPEQWLKDDDIFRQVNVEGTRNVIGAIRELGAEKLIYTSTIDVFAAARGASYDESVIDPDPKGTAYERSKQDADRLVTEEVAKGLFAVFLHPSALYGPGPAGSPGINDLVIKLRDNKAPALIPGGMPVVYSADVGEGHVLAEEKAASGARYILSESYRSLPEIAGAILRALGRSKVPPMMPLPIAHFVATMGSMISAITKTPPLIPKGQLHFLQWGAEPRNDRARRELGWSPVPFEEGMKKTVELLAGRQR